MSRKQTQPDSTLAEVHPVVEQLNQLDRDLREAFVDALAVGAFVCGTILSHDSYGAAEGHASNKPESKAPGVPQNMWAQKRVLALLKSIISVGEQVEDQLNARRDEHETGVKVPRPQGVAGRPVKITDEQIAQFRAMREAHIRPTNMAHSGIIPKRTFWQLLKRGRREQAGPERELYVAVYGEEGRAS